MLKPKRGRYPVTGKRGRRSWSPFALIGVGVTALIMLSAVGIFVIPRLFSHADDLNMNCTLLVPANPLTAQGLATPYQLSATNPADGPCNEANTGQSAFVQSVIYNPRTGAFSVYNPLIIDQGTQPAVAPVVPTLPRGAVVGIWFGFNATNLTLQGAQSGTLRRASCVNGLGNSLFTQFAYCNALAFFSAANQGIRSGKVHIPALQMANDGEPCMTVRDFGIVDQDQSDNVQTQYLATANGQTAQFSTANQAQLQNAALVANPSDNALLTTFVDPALGCQPWTAPDLTNAGAPTAALALDELQAAARQANPVALVPLNDPMTVVGDNATPSLAKTNLYRMGVDQPIAWNTRQASGTTYCQNLVQVGIARLQKDETQTTNAATPFGADASNLFTFLAQRLQASYTNLGCDTLLNTPNPVTIQTDANGVAIGATFAGQSTAPAATATPAPAATATPASAPTTPPATPTAAPTVGTTPTDPAMPTPTPATN